MRLSQAALDAETAAAQLLGCLEVLGQGPALHLHQQQEQQLAPGSSSSVEGQQLGELAEACSKLRELMTGKVKVMAELCKAFAAVLDSRSSSSSSRSTAADFSNLGGYSEEQLLEVLELLRQLPRQVLAVLEGLCAALPVSCCCNNPGCANLAGASEQQLVAGKGCVCARCRTARYCCRACQELHWPQHKPVCKRLKAARAAAAAAGAAVPAAAAPS